MTISTQCLYCKHYLGFSTCKAFPGGIPQEIFDGSFDHTNPYTNDNGIQFELNDLTESKNTLQFNKSEKIVLPFKKSERGTHTGNVRVKRGGTVFIREQRLGVKKKEKGKEIKSSHDYIKEVEKSSLHPDNFIEFISLDDLGIIPGIHEGDTYICKFKDESKSIHKVMGSGEIIGEIGSCDTSKIIGWDVVPETIQADYGEGIGSSQKFINGSLGAYSGYREGYETDLDESHFGDLSKIFVLDAIMGNFDRHGDNIQIDENGKCWAIDNESIGKFHCAELFMESLESYALPEKRQFKSTEFPTPMMSVMKSNFGDDRESYRKFSDHVGKSIDEMVAHKDEIVKYWSRYNESKATNMGIPVREGVKNIEKNIKYLEEYRKL